MRYRIKSAGGCRRARDSAPGDPPTGRRAPDGTRLPLAHRGDGPARAPDDPGAGPGTRAGEDVPGPVDRVEERRPGQARGRGRRIRAPPRPQPGGGASRVRLLHRDGGAGAVLLKRVPGRLLGDTERGVGAGVGMCCLRSDILGG